MTATMKVVRLASTTVASARANPESKDCTIERPELRSSRTRSKMMTLESTAMPMVRTMPAMPGSVSVAPSRVSDATISATLAASAMLAISPSLP